MILEEKVINVIRENADYQDEIKLKDNLVNKLGVDSLDFLMIINTLEEDFSIRIEDNDLKGVETVWDVIEKLKVKLLLGKEQ